MKAVLTLIIFICCFLQGRYSVAQADTHVVNQHFSHNKKSDLTLSTSLVLNLEDNNPLLIEEEDDDDEQAFKKYLSRQVSILSHLIQAEQVLYSVYLPQKNYPVSGSSKFIWQRVLRI